MEKEHLEYDPGDFLNKAVKWEIEENKGLSFNEALVEAQKKYPEMARRCRDQLRGLWPPSDWILTEP
jgi:hypothetical protein